MPKLKVNARTLRQLAEDLLDEIAVREDTPEGEREECVTSLVRQWLTYDGGAAVFVGDELVYFALGRTPLGKASVVPESAGHGWVRRLTREWKVSPDDLPEALDQLNRGQSAEVVNGDGVPLRLWVNPRERCHGVEPLVKEDRWPAAARDYSRMAADELERHCGADLDPEEVDELARSVAGQWRRHGGHACLFLGSNEQLVLRLNGHGDGTCEVVATRLNTDLGRWFSSLGFPPEVHPELIARLNTAQEVGFRDRDGVQARLWYDPKARRIWVQPLGPVPPGLPGVAPPILCPNCTAVLRPWREGERQQSCPLCGHTISHS
jgi:hypothetical protein